MAPERYRTQARVRCPFDVGNRIIADHHGTLRRHPQLAERQLKNLPLRLAATRLLGNHDRIEQVPEPECRNYGRLKDAASIRDNADSCSPLSKPAQNLCCSGHFRRKARIERDVLAEKALGGTVADQLKFANQLGIDPVFPYATSRIQLDESGNVLRKLCPVFAKSGELIACKRGYSTLTIVQRPVQIEENRDGHFRR